MPLSKDDPMYLTDTGLDLLSRFFALNPEDRISAQEALSHPWFSEHPIVADQATMPKFPPMNEISREQLKKNKLISMMKKRNNSLDERQIAQREQIYENEERYTKAVRH
jgi:serine/threonine protein kinase